MLRDLILLLFVGTSVGLAACIFFFALEDKLRRIKSGRSIVLWALGFAIIILGGLGVVFSYSLGHLRLHFVEKMIHIPWPNLVIKQVPIAIHRLSPLFAFLCPIVIIFLISSFKGVSSAIRRNYFGNLPLEKKDPRLFHHLHFPELLLVAIGISFYKFLFIGIPSGPHTTYLFLFIFVFVVPPTLYCTARISKMIYYYEIFEKQEVASLIKKASLIVNVVGLLILTIVFAI